ncbi:Disease resistance protein RGA2 [Bienertia sinuspersici]
MAEVAEAILNEIIKNLGSTLWKNIKFANNLGSHMGELHLIKSSIEEELKDEDPFEVDGNKKTKIEMLQSIKDKVDELFDDQAFEAKQKELRGSSGFAAKVCLFFSPSEQFVSPLQIVRKIKSIMKQIETINRMPSAGLPHNNRSESSAANRNIISSLDDSPLSEGVVFGRDRYINDIITLFRDFSNGQQSLVVAAIIGIGGQGKTALAKHVFKDRRMQEFFDVELWVSCSPCSNFPEIGENILEFFNYPSDGKPFQCGTAKFHPFFLRRSPSRFVGKKCLLVLDNIWYQHSLNFEWQTLRNSLEKRCDLEASRIMAIITTRSESVAEIMGATQTYMFKLDCLSESDALLVLQHYALLGLRNPDGQVIENPGVEANAKQIVGLCPRVPLVLKHIGLQLGDTQNELQKLKDRLALKPALELEKNVLQTLKICYDRLDEKLKRCAAYCSLFPPSMLGAFNTSVQVRYWMALGFIEPREEESLEDAGKRYVQELARQGFFEPAYNWRKNETVPFSDGFDLHGVMHDLIVRIGKSKHKRIDSETNKIDEGVQHVSLDTRVTANWDVLFSEFKGDQLQSIVLVCSHGWNSGTGSLGSGIEKLISRFPFLRVLQLRGEGIEKVPKSIGKLRHLRHLDLSRNPFFKLPNSITKLVHLLSFDLSLCENLQELPRDMGKLVNLRHLWLRDTSLSHMPKGFGNLTQLQTLDKFVVVGENNSRCSKENVGAKLEELGRLNNIKGPLVIYVRGQSEYIASEASKAEMEMKKGLTSLVVIFEKRGKDNKMLVESLLPSGENLEGFTLRNYGGEKLPNWMTGDGLHERFPKLVKMNLCCCELTNPMSWDEHVPFRYEGDDEYLWMRVENNEDDLLEWVPEYSRLKEQLKIGPMELDFLTKGRNQLTLRDLALGHFRLTIEKQLAPRSCGQHQPDFLLKSCFPNLVVLELREIPELEVLPGELRDLSSLKCLEILNCPKFKELPSWIDSLSSLVELFIEGAPELKALPDSIGNLTFLRELVMFDCPSLESLPHQISNLYNSCTLNMAGFSEALFEKCREPTGEYWPLIQHLRVIFQGRNEFGI